MSKKVEKKAVKKTYEKPMLRVVNIAPGVQTLGNGCKLATAGIGPSDNPCVSQACVLIGS